MTFEENIKKVLRGKTRKSGELEEQIKVFEWARKNEKKHHELRLLYASANGGKRDIRTATLLKMSGVKAGIPDIHLPKQRHDFLSLYIEMKHGKNKLSKSQKIIKKLLEEAGNKVVVYYSSEEAINEIKNYLSI